MRKCAYKKLGVGDVISWQHSDKSIWLGTIFKRTVVERLNERTGRWKWVMRHHIMWNESEGPESYIEEKDWKTCAFQLVSTAK